MTELEKLKHLIGHWIEHNEAHLKTYSEWGEKADLLGKKEVSEILRKVVAESRKQGELFKKALEIIK